MSVNMKMTVNVSLCGSIPRSQMNGHFCPNKGMAKSLSLSSSSCSSASSSDRSTAAGMLSTRSSLPRQVSHDTIASAKQLNAPAPPPIIEPPSWAVAARGDAKLEPVCESLNVQTSIDLTTQAVFRIGRSQNSDIQLLHCTSSRRHAILFHHPNRSCYIVDCGSAHGTYVNGVRVKTVMQTVNEDGSPNPSGIILPHRVKKGALIRFGGPGAPSFILKSFSVGLDSLVYDLEETNTVNICKDVNRIDESEPLTCDKSKDGKGSLDALVSLNTRLNAVGGSVNSLRSKRDSLSLTSARLHSQLQPQTQNSNISFLRKRSIAVSFDDDDDEPEIQCFKKQKNTRTAHQPSFKDIHHALDIAIVSPTRSKPTLQFNFDEIERPVVSPTPLDNNEAVMNLNDTDALSGLKSILTTPFTLPSSSRKTHRVIFSEKPPEVFYPPSVTPESSSDCEG
jgi:hypothetical protein